MSASSRPLLAICDALRAALIQGPCSLAAQGHASHARGLYSSARSLAAKGGSGAATQSAGQEATTSGSNPHGSSSNSNTQSTDQMANCRTSSGTVSSANGKAQPGSPAAASSPMDPAGTSTAHTTQPGVSQFKPAAPSTVPNNSASAPKGTPGPAIAAATPTTMTATAEAAASAKEGSVAGGAGTAPAIAALIPKAALKAALPSQSVAVASGSPLTAAAERLQVAGATLNRLTGYDMIAELKGRVAAADERLQELKRSLQASKAKYEARISEHSQLQKELNALLQRKSSWGQDDVQRFTQMYASEHATEQAVAAAKAEYARLGEAVEDAQLAMMSTIRERYTQEQLWSDHIRQASTWWTWGLMGLHFASFVAVYAFLEPRKRAALREALAEDAHQQAEQTRAAFTQALAAAASTAISGSNHNGDVAGGGERGGDAQVLGASSLGSSSSGSWGGNMGSSFDGGWEAAAAAGLAAGGAGASNGGGAVGGGGSEALAGLSQQLGCVLEEVRGLQKQLGQLGQQQQQQQQQRQRHVGAADSRREQSHDPSSLMLDKHLPDSELAWDDSTGLQSQQPSAVSESGAPATGWRGAAATAWRRLGERMWPGVSVSGAQVALLATGSAVTGAAVAVLLSSRK